MLPSQLYCEPTRSEHCQTINDNTIRDHSRASWTMPNTDVYESEDLGRALAWLITRTAKHVLIKLLQEIHHDYDRHEPQIDLPEHQSVFIKRYLCRRCRISEHGVGFIFPLCRRTSWLWRSYRLAVVDVHGLPRFGLRRRSACRLGRHPAR